MEVKVQKNRNRLQELVKGLQKLDKDFVEVGHFKEQGTHYSGFSYPKLMEIHHNGGNTAGSSPLPPRPVLDILFFRNRNLTDMMFKRAFKAWGGRTLGTRSNGILLEDLGKVLQDKERKIFGSSDLAPNAVPPKNRNEPLVATGDLRSKVAYRTSTSRKIKE